MAGIIWTWAKHLLIRFGGNMVISCLFVWLWIAVYIRQLTEEDEIGRLPKSKSVVYHILKIIGITGYIGFGLAALCELIHSIILALRIAWNLMTM